MEPFQIADFQTRYFCSLLQLLKRDESKYRCGGEEPFPVSTFLFVLSNEPHGSTDEDWHFLLQTDSTDQAEPVSMHNLNCE